MTMNCILLSVLVSVSFIGKSVELSPNYFCAEANPQTHVIIDQLMGMWFGVEIIDHMDERHYIRRVPSCPIIHISEERDPSSTFPPLHKNYNYGYNYGEGPGYTTTYSTQKDYRKKMRPEERYHYDKETMYGDHNEYPANKVQHFDLGRQPFEMKYLRLYWDENGENTEYHMRYNVSKAGMWISSGPENDGASLDRQFSHFAGTIQVLKAVGNHLVLTFCHQLPQRQLYTILLSRQLNLDSVEIHGVHNMLNRRGLITHSIKKVCQMSHASKPHVYTFLLLIVVSSALYS